MSLDSWINAGSLAEFEGGEAFTRLRAGERTDPYSNRTAREDWSPAAVARLPLPAAYLASAGSAESLAPSRRQTATKAQLVIPDASTDVQPGDRVEHADGRLWRVTGYGERDRNPWTGWQPTLVVNLEEHRG